MLDADAGINNNKKWVGSMPIRTQLLKKWVGLDPEKHIGSTPLSRAKIYAVRVSYAADDAHRPPQHGSAAAHFAAALGTDRRTQYRFNTLTAHAVRVISESPRLKTYVQSTLVVQSRAGIASTLR